MSLLIQLVAELEIVNGEMLLPETGCGDDGHAIGYHRHWAIREAINAAQAQTLLELQVKARAAEIELERGAEDCFGLGSFLELSRSLINNFKEIQPAETRLQTAG
jgi:hypothetical protein